jgi:hypothetical protein
MTRNILLYIKDILQNMQDAQDFIRGMSYEKFVADKKTFNALCAPLRLSARRQRMFPKKPAQNTPPSPGGKWPE